MDDKMYMNIVSGTVQSMGDWEADQVTLGFDPEDLTKLVEVVKDANGDWIED